MEICSAFPKGFIVAAGRVQCCCLTSVQVLGDRAEEERDYGGGDPLKIFQLDNSIGLAEVEYLPSHITLCCDYFIGGTGWHSC